MDKPNEMFEQIKKEIQEGLSLQLSDIVGKPYDQAATDKIMRETMQNTYDKYLGNGFVVITESDTPGILDVSFTGLDEIMKLEVKIPEGE